ncbi:uncharacterized protein METZ01_LOCUS424643, partial [marine metagenome]
GIQPDILLCRTEERLANKLKEKIALFCNVEVNSVITAMDVKNIYEVPLSLEEEGLSDIITSKLGVSIGKPNLDPWKRVVKGLSKPKYGEVDIAVVGKYVDLQDSYKSLTEALIHGGISNDVGVKIHWLDAGTLEDDSALSKLNRYNGILVPGGFGERGIEGKIKAIEYARVNRVPFFGICLGMHCAVIEFARSVVLLRKANSAEFAPNTPDPVIDLLLDQDAKGSKGGTMRLGEYRCQLRKNSNAFKAYGVREVYERHRHRYEFNNRYR